MNYLRHGITTVSFNTSTLILARENSVSLSDWLSVLSTKYVMTSTCAHASPRKLLSLHRIYTCIE